MSKVKGSINVPHTHPEFAALRESVGSKALKYVSIPPTHPRYATLRASEATASEPAAAPRPALTDREKYDATKQAIEARREYEVSREAHAAALAREEEARVNMMRASQALTAFMTLGTRFKFAGRDWMMTYQGVEESGPLLDVDALAGKASPVKRKKKS